MSECTDYLFSVSLVILCAEVYLLTSGDVYTPGNEPLSRGLFVLAFTLFFFLTRVFKYTFGLFTEGRTSSLLSLLPTALLLFLMNRTGAFPFLSYALAAAAAAGVFWDFVPRKDLLLLWGTFALDAAALYLFLVKHTLSGSFTTDKILFVSLVVLTLSSLQRLLAGGKRGAFPLHYFVLLGALIMLLPMEKSPIDWSPLANAGGQLVRKVSDLTDSATYFLFSGLDDGTYTTGYSSLDMNGGKVSDSERIQLILRTSEKPYFTYTDADTSGKMRVRRSLYLAGGRGADRQQLVRFLRFLHARGVDRLHAALFSKISRINVEYSYLDTFDEIAPAGSFLLYTEQNGDSHVPVESGVSTSRHKKGYKIAAVYLDIDYGSPYLAGLFRESPGLPKPDDLTYEAAREYTKDLFAIDLKDVLSEDEFESFESETLEFESLIHDAHTEDPAACLDTAGASGRMQELAGQLTDGAQSDYEKCKRIETYLRQYRYDLNASGGHDPESDMNSPAGMSDIADRFLFETGSGYCVHYTSSMVMLLRLAGIPARAVPGYRYVFPLEQQEYYEVAGNCAHVWPEAYLDQIGWVPFEPTTAFRTAEAYTWHRTAPEPASDDPDPAASELPEPPAIASGTLNREETSAGTATQLFQISGLVVLCIALLLAALIAGRCLLALMRYKFGTPEKKLLMDVEMIRKLLRRCAPADFSDRGLLSDYVSLAPEDLRPDLQRVFDTYYRVIYGNGSEPPVSEQENALAGKVREKLSHSASASHSPTDRKTSASGAT